MSSKNEILESIEISVSDLLEITERQAIKLFNSGKVVYVCTDDNKPTQGFNCFWMCKTIQDASLNYHCLDIFNITIEEQIRFIRTHQAEPIYFYTLNSTQLWIVD